MCGGCAAGYLTTGRVHELDHVMWQGWMMQGFFRAIT